MLDLNTNLTPEQKEESKALAEEKIKEQTELSGDPLEIGSKAYAVYSPQFEDSVNQMSTGQLRRLAKALIMHRMSKKQYADPTDTRLKETIAMGLHLLECRFLMQMVMGQQAMEQEKDSLIQPTENQGEQNGV